MLCKDHWLPIDPPPVLSAAVACVRPLPWVDRKGGLVMPFRFVVRSLINRVRYKQTSVALQSADRVSFNTSGTRPSFVCGESAVLIGARFTITRMQPFVARSFTTFERTAC